MKVIAKNNGETYLVSVDDDLEAVTRNPHALGRVLSMERRRLFPQRNIHSLLARGPWYETTMTEKELQEKLKLVDQNPQHYPV